MSLVKQGTKYLLVEISDQLIDGDKHEGDSGNDYAVGA